MAHPAEPPFPPQTTAVSPDDDHERREFRQTFKWVTGVHLFALLLFFIAGFLQPRKKPEQVTWLIGGEAGGGENPGAADATAAESEIEPEVTKAPPEAEPPLLDPPVASPPKPSELVLPQATPIPPKPVTPKPATPKPTTPKASPKPETPKPSTPKPLAKTTPKKAVSPKPPAVAEKSKASPGATKNAAKPETSGKGLARTGTAGAAVTGSGKGTGKVGSGPGSGAASDFGPYFALLRDRYYAVWNQPTSLDRAAGDLITTLRIKAQRDGTVLNSEIVKSSGNSVMDGSVLAAAEQVTKIDPIPDGLGREEVLEIPINFKLDQGQ